MSWLESNYEKAAVGGAAGVAVVLAFLGYLKFSGVQDDFTAESGAEEKKDPSVQNAAMVDKAIASRSRQVLWLEPVGPGDRKLPLLTGVPLFVRKDNPDEAIDLFTAEPVHPPIDNKWWIEYRLDPGKADAPQQDEDSDGFTNLEEFLAKTSPADAKDFPPLIGKLRFDKDISVAWSLRPGFPEMNKTDLSGGRFYLDSNNDPDNRPRDPANRTALGAPLKPGDMIFIEEPMKLRFKFLGLEERRLMNPRLNIEETKTIARFEDQKPNKKGMVHEFEAPLNEGRIWADDVIKFDREAVLVLEAGSEKGATETIAENTRFGLPFSSAKKDYLLKKVTPQAVEVEYTDAKSGETKTVTIPQGQFPNLEAK
ncbi:MAG: hypothetical protein MUF04_08165 [Akkermansiaceae bacterium]|jgi:hypothetical protein|nr:hypothetical protein [Akkermansiaceae bacterium]